MSSRRRRRKKKRRRLVSVETFQVSLSWILRVSSNSNVLVVSCLMNTATTVVELLSEKMAEKELLFLPLLRPHNHHDHNHHHHQSKLKPRQRKRIALVFFKTSSLNSNVQASIRTQPDCPISAIQCRQYWPWSSSTSCSSSPSSELLAS